MKQSIFCIIKNVYGKELIYPNCETSKAFARIAGTKTLSIDNLKNIGAIGFYVEFEREVSSLEKQLRN